MKRIFGAISFAAFLLVMAAVGGLEQGSMDMQAAAPQMIMCTVLWLAGLFLCQVWPAREKRARRQRRYTAYSNDNHSVYKYGA